MSIKVRAKVHPFKDEYTDFYREAAPLSEIFAGLASPLDITHARFLIGDEMVADAGRTPPDGSTVYVNIVPTGTGNQMQDAGKGSFWAGFGITLLAIGAFFIPVVGIGLGSALLGVGVSAMLGGAVLLNTEIPTPSVSSRDTGDQMESIRGSKNRIRKSGYVPVLFGRHLITPDVAALPYTEIDAGGQQWLTQLFCAGYNDMTIETGSFKVGDTALAELSSTKNIAAILAGTDAQVKLEIIQNGAASALYPRICVEQQFNSILKHSDDDGNLTPVTHTTPEKTTAINVDIMFPQGLVEYKDDGGKKSASVTITVRYKPDGAPDTAYTNFPGWAPAVSGETVDMFRRQAGVSGLAPGKYTVEIARVTPDSADNKTVDAVYAGSIRAFAGDRPVRQEAAQNLVIIALKIRASALANGIIDNFNFVAQAKIPDYTPSTGAWTPRLTKNPASMLLYTLRGKINPAPVADTDIDWDSLKEFWTFCNDKGYACNAVQGDRELFSVLCAKIAKTGRASILRVNGKFSVVIDQERPAPVQLFSPRNTINYRQTIVKADVPDEIVLEFIDETRGWVSNEREVYNTPDGLPAGTEKTKQTSSVWGITDPDTVFKFARYQYACITNRPIVHTLECDIEYLLCRKGDLIEYAGDTALAGIAYGKVTRVILYEGAAIGIAADTVFPQEAGKNYGIRCRKSNGQLITLNAVNRETGDKELRFETPQPAGILEEGDLVIFGITGQITRRLIVTEIAPAGDFRAVLTAVDYSPEIFNVDDPAYTVPPFDNKITTSGSITDSGIVNAEEWQTWFTYHDSAMMPARPSGGGTAGGWHRCQTPESRWVSMKTAKSITGGGWSIPAQTSFMVDEALRNIIAGTADVGRPDIVTGLKALAGKDAIHITWNPLGDGLKNDIKHIRVEIKKNAAGDWQIFEVRGGDFVYNFDRSADGYPEASGLAAWRIRAKAVNIYGQESAAYAPDAGGQTIDTSGYGSWKPAAPALAAASSGRTVSLAAPAQTWYGAAGCEYQISKPVAGTPWYAPAMADTQTVYANESSWKGAEGGYYTAGTQLTQQLPLEGQAAGTPKDTAYKYRARALTKAYDGSILYRSEWSPETAALAKGTGVRDVVEAAIGSAQLQQGAVQNSNIGDETIGYEKFNPSVKPPRKVTALPVYPYSGYVQGDTVILLSGTTAKDEKLYRLVNPAAAGTAGWSGAVDGADLVDATIAIAKMAGGVRPTRTVSALPAAADANYQTGDTVVLLGDSKVYRLTSNGWIKTLDGVDILANTIRASSLNVLAKNVVNPFTGGLKDGWELSLGCSIVDDDVSGLKVLQLVDDTAGTVKIGIQSAAFEVLPNDIYMAKFGIECLTSGLNAGQGLFIGIGPAFGIPQYRRYAFNPTNKKWQPDSASTNNPYFLNDYRITARNQYTSFILGKDADIASVPAPEYTDGSLSVYCIQLLATTSCFFRDGINSPAAPRSFKLICPQVYRLDSGKILAENITAHSITANEMAAHTLTAQEMAANSLTANEIAANSITAAQLAVGDFTNYATVNENYPASAVNDATVLFRGTKILDGYIQKYTAAQTYLLLANFTEGSVKKGDEFYYEFIAKAAAAVTATFRLGTASAVTRNAAGVVTAFTNTISTGATPGINAATGTTVHNLTTDEVLFKGAIKITNDNVGNGKFLYIFLQDDSPNKAQCYLRKIIVRKKNAGEMIIDGAVKTNHMEAGSIHGDRIKAGTLTANEIAANTIRAENLNVLAKNIVNPFINGTSEGWATNGAIVNVEGLGYVLRLSYVSGRIFTSNAFTVLPDDSYVFKFGAESLIELSVNLGLFIGLTQGQMFHRYCYNFDTKEWEYRALDGNAYFLYDYRAAARKYYTTYILGSRVDISQVPAPTYTDENETYAIYCLQLTGTDTACRIRSGYNPGQPADAAWYFIQPQVYRLDSSKILAENIIAKNLSAVSASLGKMTGNGDDEDDEYKIVLSDGFSTVPAGQPDLNKKGTFLLGPAAGESTIRRWWTGSVWKMIIRMSALILENLKSKVIGLLQVFGDWQDHDNTAVKPVFEANPGSDPAANNGNHSGSVTARGAFRVRRSTADETPVFEALPSGRVNVPGSFSVGRRTYDHPVQHTGIPAQDTNILYYVNIGTIDLFSGVNVVIREQGNGIWGSFQIASLVGVFWSRKITCKYNKNNAGSGIVAIILKEHDGNLWSSPVELWVKIIVTGGQDANLFTYVSDDLSGEFLPAAANYQTGMPSNIIQTLEITGVGGIATSGKIEADSMAVAGTAPSTSPGSGALTVAGGAGIAGALNVGGAAKAGEFFAGAPSEGYFVRITGDMIEFYQGGVMKASIKLGLAAGAMSLLMGGLPISCEGILSQGDISGESLDPTTAWTAIGNSTFGTNNINSIAYGGGRFVAVGDSGKIAYSADGIIWTAVGDSTFGTNFIDSVAYGGGRFVAGGNSGKMAYSADGIIWTETNNLVFLPHSIAYGDGKFVAVGYDTKTAYSTDGIDWTNTSSLPSGIYFLDSITYGGGKFVAVGPSGKMVYSNDGINWAAVNNSTFGTSNISSIVYGGGRFVAVGDSGKIACSADGITWTAAGNSTFGTNNIYSIAYGGGRFVAGGYSGKIAHSVDGIIWTAIDNSTFGANENIYPIAYGSGKFVAYTTARNMAYWAAVITAKLIFNPNGTTGWIKA